MSDFNKYARDNNRFNNDPLQGAENSLRKAQIYNRNATTFNPIGFDPNPQNSYDDDEKRKQKEKQNIYRDQLNQMAQGNQGTKPYERNSAEGQGNQYAHIEADVRREFEQRHPQAGTDDQRRGERNNEGIYGQDQQRRLPDYERPQPQPGDYEKNYDLQHQQHHQLPPYQQQQAYHPAESYDRHPSELKPQGAHHPEVDKYAQKPEEKHDTFEQQDYLREQLLAKIRTGYTKSNAHVYNAYQQAYEQKERDKQEFERNVVEKAARDKILKDDYRAMVEHDQKKKLQKDALLSNQQAIESKTAQEKRQKALETATENQRIQDSLYQFERQSYQQKEALKKRQQENARILEQQRQDYYGRKGDKGFNDVRPGQNVASKKDSIDQLNYERSNQTPLQSANARTNESPMRSQSYGKNPYDRVTASMENSSLKPSYGQPENYVPGYSQDPSYQQYGRDIGNRGKSQERASYQNAQNPSNIKNTDYNAKTEYQRIRDRNRYGTNFNIISNEMN